MTTITLSRTCPDCGTRLCQPGRATCGCWREPVRHGPAGYRTHVLGWIPQRRCGLHRRTRSQHPAGRPYDWMRTKGA